ncbi:MAG TPA: SCO1664 family protein [Actinomycetota bacterium]|nr:SCO1664 family protein [Actinomycetota bacterium]
MSGRGSERLAGASQTLTLLETGELEVLGLLPRASNFTFLARVSGDGEQTLAVYKPQSGEAPLWDFPERSLAAREVAAFVVATDLGWPRVPPTVLRDGPRGPGSVQRFVAFDPDRHYLTMQRERPDDFRRVALFDVVVNNADRKSGHCLLAEDGELFVVDHGVCFHEEPKLRTVIWEFAGEAITAEEAGQMEAFGSRLREGALRERLGSLLSPTEIDAVDRRLHDLLSSGRFPHPGPGRPFPWPVV